MSYSAMGALGAVFDRRESRPGEYPACITPIERNIAKNACKPTSLRGLGAMGPFPGEQYYRFKGANPCWAEQLPACPSCLTKAQYSLVVSCLLNPSQAKCHWDKIAHLIGLSHCTQPPAGVPSCLTESQRKLLDYCNAHRYGGTNRTNNAMCWGIIAGKQLTGWQRAKDCPKCLTSAQALAYAAQIAAGRRPTAAKAAWPLCPGESKATAPHCLPWGGAAGNPPGYDLVQYCRKSGGTDAKKNAACYLFMRNPAYWSALARVQRCPETCKTPKKCWDGTEICVTKHAPGLAPHATGAKCPPLPPPSCVRTVKCWDGTEICTHTQQPGRLRTSTRRRCPPRPAATVPATVEPPGPGPGPAPAPPPPVRAGIRTGSILLLLAAAGGGIYLWRRGSAKKG